MDRLSGDLIEKIALILDDISVFHALLNATPALIRQRNIHARAIERFTIKKVYLYGTQWWYLNGKRHRENDLPAIISSNDTREWFLNGKKHRENDLPAIIHSDGTQEWWLNGKRHRENDLPAYIYADGTQWWYLNGVLHRENDLPAIIRSDSTREWWLNGVEYFPKKN